MSEKWKLIVEVHQYTKALITLAEEVAPGLKSFIPPLKEQRDALEHVIRAKAFELELQNVNNPNYVDNQIDKTLGHIYRAYFDVADYFCILMRKRISDALSNYESVIIETGIPQYYSEIRPQLENINNDIARIRQAKDIAKTDGLIDEVEKYRITTQELYEYTILIEKSIPKLDEIKESITYIKKISIELSNVIDRYDIELINKVFPNYYSEIKPKIDFFAHDVQNTFQNKEIIEEFNIDIKSKIPTLEKLKSKKWREDIKKYFYGGFGSILMYIICRWLYEIIFNTKY